MKVKFEKKFLNYAAATAWLHERGYSAVIPDMNDVSGPCTITLEGDEAVRAIEEDAGAKVVSSEAA